MKIWHSDDFENREDLSDKIKKGIVNKGDHFEGTVGKIIESGAFVHMAYDPKNHFKWFDGYIPQKEFSSDIDIGRDLIVESTIKDYIFNIDDAGNERMQITLSLKGDSSHGHLQDNSLNLTKEYADNFNPIDTSDLEVDGAYSVSIIPVKEDIEIYKYLLANMKSLGSEIPKLEDIPVEERCSLILDNLFRPDFNTQVYIRNLSMNDNLRLGLRCKRVLGDWLDTELNLPVKQSLLIEGVLINMNKTISVSKICIIPNSEECMPYEIECELMPVNMTSAGSTRLSEIVVQVPSLYKTTEYQLELWEDYLKWRKKIVETQLIGCKYIDRYYDSDAKQIVFTLVAKDEETYRDIRGKLKDNVLAYSNNYSDKDWEFSLNRDAKSRDVKKELLGKRGKVIKEYYWKEKNADLVNSDYSILEDLRKTYPNPYIIKVPYGLSPQVEQYISENELSDDGIELYIKGTVLPEYPTDGFIALSAAGEFILIKRLQNAIEQLKRGENYSPRLCNWIFDSKNARKAEDNNVELEWKNKDIESNEFQKKAVLGILNAPDLFLLQGPPGTGKTTVIAEAIYQLIKQGKRVLLSSQSNDAVDEALNRLSNDPMVRAFRIGRKKNDLDERTNRYSEDTVLSEFYKSISSKINEKFLLIWEQNEKLKNQYEFDLRDLKNYSDDLTDLINKSSNLSKKIEELNKSKNGIINEIGKITQEYFDKIDESKQLPNFKSFIHDDKSDVPFFLSKKQLQYIEKDITEAVSICWSYGFAILPYEIDFRSQSPMNSNELLKILITNFKRIMELKEFLDANQDSNLNENLELLSVQQELNIIAAKMKNPALSDYEYEKFFNENNELMRRQRKMLHSSHSKGDVIKNYKDLFLSDIDNVDSIRNLIPQVCDYYKSFIKKMEEKLNELSTLSSSNENMENLDKQKRSIEGKIKVCNQELENTLYAIKHKQSTLADLRKKYEIPSDSTEKDIDYKINELIKENQNKINDSREIRDYWGSTLEAFKKRLDEVSVDEKSIRFENEMFLKNYIKACNVVGISCTADPRFLEDKDFSDFDVVIIDEVSKATPPELLLSLMKGRKTVLVGDHRQLPPTFGQHEGSFKTFANQVQNSEEYDDETKKIMTMDYLKKYKDMVTASLFKKHFDNPDMDQNLKSTLKYQYRMHSDIMNIVNNFYPGTEKLLPGWTPEQEKIKKAHNLTIKTEKVPIFITPENHAYWIDSSRLPSGKSIYDITRGNSTSLCNLLEQKMTLNLLDLIDKKYVEMGYPEKCGKVSVGVICLYQLQVNDLRKKLKEISRDPVKKYKAINVVCNTIDRFQGQEKEIIIVNLVCNKPYNSKGSEHITSYERINVALSRAQKLLIIIGSQEYFKAIPVELPTEGNNVLTQTIYKSIYSELYMKGCFFGSSTLISARDEQEIAIEERMIETEKAELGIKSRRW